MDITGTLQLPQLGIIKATGTQAAQFLSAQLSANITQMGENKAQFAAYCSAQGRVLASFIVLQNAPEEFLLIGSSDILEVTLARLNKFIMRTQVQLSIAEDLVIYAQAHPAATKSSVDPLTLKKDDDTIVIELFSVQNIQRQLLICNREKAFTGQHPLSADTWGWLNIRSGFLMVDAATREQFIPQMLNYESLGAIDFNKGCYPGQEVVTRSQFRGTVKRRLTILHIEQKIQSGDTVLVGEEEIGTILTVAPHPEQGWDALTVLPVNVQDLPLTAGAAKNKATVVPLPYALRDDF